jgi:hypothetical protein
MGIFDSDDNEDVYGLEHNVENEEPDGYLVDVTKPIQKPADFDTLCALVNHYEDMETIINSLKMKTSELIIDENPDDNDADRYTIDSEYVELFINTLESKMTEIRNILNYN